MKKTSVSYLGENIIYQLNDDEEKFPKLKTEAIKEEPEEPSFVPYRVFINHVDSYHGKRLVDVSVELSREDRFSTFIPVHVIYRDVILL